MHSFRIYVVLSFALSAAATSPDTLPIFKRKGSGLRRRQNTGAIGTGDIQDVEYSVQAKIGSSTVPLILDTGSSDIWSVSTDCTSSSCGILGSTPQISASSLTSTGVDVEINYGDSAHQTSVSGVIYTGPVILAGLQIGDQSLAVANKSTAGLEEQEISGIFGVGFPISSDIFSNLLAKTLSSTSPGSRASVTDAFISALPKQGPMVSRLITDGKMQQPMYTITLERESFDVGGNVGQLTLGKLPDGVSNDSLTWVPVRLYTEAQGGIPGPTSSPNELYPSRWEVVVDDVMLNGKTLPKPQVNASTGYTALIDSGTSFIGGPQTVVSSVYTQLSTSGTPPSSPSGLLSIPTISCSDPIHLTFMIGGKAFPVDPRDFIGRHGTPRSCTAGTLLSTDEPSSGALMSWILGTPFIKSNLVAFYFGNLTHPSTDPPRIGLLSTVPSNVDDLYKNAINEGQSEGDFDLSSIAAPTATFGAAGTNSVGVAQASTDGASPTGRAGRGGSGSSNGAARMCPQFGVAFSAIVLVYLFW